MVRTAVKIGIPYEILEFSHDLLLIKFDYVNVHLINQGWGRTELKLDWNCVIRDNSFGNNYVSLFCNCCKIIKKCKSREQRIPHRS